MPTTPFTSAETLSASTPPSCSPPTSTAPTTRTRPGRGPSNDAELAAFQGYIRGGGGFVGLHAATDAMHAVPWYSQLTGGSARFRNHPAQQQATMVVESPNHPSTTMLPKLWSRFDEWYNFTSNPREDVHVLITLDESTYTRRLDGCRPPDRLVPQLRGRPVLVRGRRSRRLVVLRPAVPRAPARRHRVDGRRGRGRRQLRHLPGGRADHRRAGRRRQPQRQAQRRRRGLPDGCRSRRGRRATTRAPRTSSRRPVPRRTACRTTRSCRSSATSSSGRAAWSATDRALRAAGHPPARVAGRPCVSGRVLPDRCRRCPSGSRRTPGHAPARP